MVAQEPGILPLTWEADWVPGSWIWSGLNLAAAVIWGVNQQVEDTSVSLTRKYVNK